MSSFNFVNLINTSDSILEKLTEYVSAQACALPQDAKATFCLNHRKKKIFEQLVLKLLWFRSIVLGFRLFYIP